MCDQFCAVQNLQRRCKKAFEEHSRYTSFILNSCFLTSSPLLISAVTTVSNGKSKWESGEPCVYVSAFTLQLPNLLFMFHWNSPVFFPTYVHPRSETWRFLFSNQALSLLRWHFCVFAFPACDVSSMFAKPVLSTFETQPHLHALVSRARGAGKCLTGPCSLGLILQAPGRQSCTSYRVSLMKAFCMTRHHLYKARCAYHFNPVVGLFLHGTWGASANDKPAKAQPLLRELTTVNHGRA